MSGTASTGEWGVLRAAAVEAMRHAYAPYSDFPVGAAGRCEDGRLVSGCNVENASYGLTLCAECGLVSQLHATGGGRLTHVVCVDRTEKPLVPCGRCRQLLWESGGPELIVLTPRGEMALRDLLSEAFGPDALDLT